MCLCKEIKWIIRMVLLIALILILNKTSVFAVGFGSNYLKLKEECTPDKEVEFIENDKIYLHTKPALYRIRIEIMILEQELSNLEDTCIKTSNGIRVYTGNSSLKNNAIRIGIINRKMLILNYRDFKYDDSAKYIIGRNYDREKRVGDRFTQKQIDDALNNVVEVIENLQMDTSFLKDTDFVILPYAMSGVNGYTLTKSNGKSTIVISGQDITAPDLYIEMSIKSKTLHEIGHVFLNKKNLELRKYNIIIDQEEKNNLDSLDKWETSERENFAEDFRIFASRKLGDKSFKPMKKKTILETDEKVFAEIMEKILAI